MDEKSLARLRELEQQWTERLKAMREEQTHAVRGRYEDEARILGHRIEVQDRALRELAALLADTQEPEPPENKHGAADVRGDRVRRDFPDRPDSRAADGSIRGRQIRAEGRAPEDEQPRCSCWMRRRDGIHDPSDEACPQHRAAAPRQAQPTQEKEECENGICPLNR